MEDDKLRIKKGRSTEVTQKIMSSIPSKGTKPEMLLRKALWRKNLRYRVNYEKLPGRPDIVFTRQRVIIFCDGDFWHGHNWAIRGFSSMEDELSNYSDYWKAKILRNVERDREIDKTLKLLGWTVLRLWESDIKKDLDSCVRRVQEALFEASLDNSKYDSTKC